MSRRTRKATPRPQPDLFSFGMRPTEGAANDDQPTQKAQAAAGPLQIEQPRSAAPAPARQARVAAEPRPGHLLDVRSAAAWLGLSKSTLDKMRHYGVGPRFIRATGRAVRYDPADLAAFADGRRQQSTADARPA